MKSKLRLNALGFSIIYSTPPFANTMLGGVFVKLLLFQKLGKLILLNLQTLGMMFLHAHFHSVIRNNIHLD